MLTIALRAVVMAAISISLLWIVHRWAIDTFPRVRPWRRKLVWLGVAAVLLQSASRWVAGVLYDPVSPVIHVVITTLVMALAIAALPIAAMRLIVWVASYVIQRRSDRVLAAAPEGPVSGLTRRQLVEGFGGASFLAGSGTMFGWGMVRGRHAFEIDEVAVRIPGLPRALDGYVIGQVSDVHTGLYVGERDLDEGLSRLRQVKADLLVVTGDIVDFDPFFAPLAAGKLGELTARDGVFAILGNHDHYTGAALVTEALRRAGVRVLVNEGLVVRPGDGGGFALLGVDDLWSATRGGSGPLLARAQAMVPDDRACVLLSHQPPTVDLWAGRVALQLSGHTHGGQVNPGFRPADYVFRYVSGRYEVSGTTLYVNRGFGTVGPPARIMAPPEVTRIILVAA
jgi:predicted MPP superfamily phosphohydrolase